jgi:hypothetical protein
MERRRVQAQVQADAMSVRRRRVLHRSKNKRELGDRRVCLQGSTRSQEGENAVA